MATLTESETYEASIYQLETTDPVLGGPQGVSNKQAKQLANRTNWLKANAEKLQRNIDAVRVLGEVQMLAAPGYKASDYEANGLGKANTTAAGWALCNGENGTADMRGRFVVGLDPNRPDYAVGATGGEETHTLTVNELPSHAHPLTLPYGQSNDGSGQSVRTDSRRDGTKSYNTEAVGGNQPHENRPPFYVVVFRQRVV